MAIPKRRMNAMDQYKKGRSSFQPPVSPVLTAWSSVAGKKESEGPLGACFDKTDPDAYWGEKTYEQAESRMQKDALEILLRKGGLSETDIGLVFSGDLLNQCVGSSFSLRNTGIPALGLYGACSTMAESLLLALMAVGGGMTDTAVAMTSSHFASSERQYRFPLGYGGQRPPTAQWTVTGCGAALVRREGRGPRLEAATIGTITDWGLIDANNMGAAMAPAALSTLLTHFDDLGRSPKDYDMIVTGDLGQIGKELLQELALKEGLQLGPRYEDCGCLIFDNIAQDVHAGGSGCGCSAAVLCGSLLDRMQRGELHSLLFCGTGALLSPLSTQQGLPIPGVCHAISILGGEGQ